MNDVAQISPDQAMPVHPAKATHPVRPGAAALRKVRAELNLEKWPGVWQPAKSKNEKTLRVLQREITNDDGTKVISRVEIGYTHLGTLTTEERKMYGALIELWEDSGKPADRPVFFSDRLLARILKKGWGTNVRDAIVKSLRKLRTVPIEWINSYYQKTDEGKTVLRERTPFTILSELKIVEKEVDGAVNRAVGYFKADDRILRNLLANFTKPLLLDVMINLKSDIGVLLYSHVDLMLARKGTYERRTKELFEDLGLTNPEYNRQYERYRALKKAVTELQGVRLSTGVLKEAILQKTIDGKDYKAVFKKAAAPELPTVDEVPSAVVIRHYARATDPAALQAEELVLHFHRLMHGVNTHEPQSRELGQAMGLIGQYGLEKSKHIVDYTKQKALETNFKIQHFGAVLSYTSRGAADFDRMHREAVPQRTRAVALKATKLSVPAATRGHSRMAALTPEQYRARFDAARSVLMRDNPFFARQAGRGSKLEAEIVRSRLVRDLDAEPMDLLPTNWLPGWFPAAIRETGGPKIRLL